MKNVSTRPGPKAVITGPLDASPFSLDDDCILVAELEATSSRRSQVVKDRSVKDLLGPVGAPIVIGRTDDQAREDIKKKGWKAKLDRRRRFARGAPASPARPRSAG